MLGASMRAAASSYVSKLKPVTKEMAVSRYLRMKAATEFMALALVSERLIDT